MPLPTVPTQPHEKPWYAEGLRFKCTGCGGCCTGAPGAVWVTAEEVQAMADHLGLSIDAFCEQYLRSIGNRISLKEDPDNFDCVFLEDGKRCSIYGVRPTQCRTFPWWPANLENQKEWREAARWCEGINHPDAPVVPLEQIEQQRQIEESIEDDRCRFG